MLLALLLVAFSVIQSSPGPRAKNDGDQKELERLEGKWNGAHIRGNAAALERILAEDLVVVVPAMRVMTKADALGMFTSGVRTSCV